MTTTEKVTRRPFQRAPKDQPRVTRSNSTDGPGAVVAVKASSPIEGLTIGGEPRVHLLPPQVLARKKGKAIRRRLALAVIGMLVLVGVATGLAEVASISAQSALTSAQATTTSILAQQAKFGDVVKIKSDSANIITSQQMATQQEILWAPLFSNFQKTLPSDATIATFAASVDNPDGSTTSTTGASDPLQATYVATLTVSVSMKQSEISGWLNTLPALKGFVDATPNSVTKSTGGGYTVNATVHLNELAFSNRFPKAVVK